MGVVLKNIQIIAKTFEVEKARLSKF